MHDLRSCDVVEGNTFGAVAEKNTFARNSHASLTLLITHHLAEVVAERDTHQQPGGAAASLLQGEFRGRKLAGSPEKEVKMQRTSHV